MTYHQIILCRAVSVIRDWHGEEAFDIYYDSSPEMEPIRKELRGFDLEHIIYVGGCVPPQKRLG